jgi:hypothetical protein
LPSKLELLNSNPSTEKENTQKIYFKRPEELDTELKQRSTFEIYVKVEETISKAF